MPRANSKTRKKDMGWLTWEEVRKKNVKVQNQETMSPEDTSPEGGWLSGFENFLTR